MTLAELEPGNCAKITAINTRAQGILRLMVLGLVEGVEVTHRQAAIGGDPIEIEVMGAAISVRLEQASHVNVEAS